MNHDENYHKYLTKDISSIKRGLQTVIRELKNDRKTINKHEKRIDIAENNIKWHRTIWGLIVALLGLIGFKQ